MPKAETATREEEYFMQVVGQRAAEDSVPQKLKKLKGINLKTGENITS